MPRASREQVSKRHDEILDACQKLFWQAPTRRILIKDIAKETSISRPSIYNYFETVEEILLSLYERELLEWAADVRSVVDSHETMSIDAFADAIGETLENRHTMLRIKSLDMYHIEENSRDSFLCSFKAAYKKATEALDEGIKKFLPHKTDEDLVVFNYIFLPFINGAYPFTAPTEKQKQAMDAVGIKYHVFSIRTLVSACLKKLLV